MRTDVPLREAKSLVGWAGLQLLLFLLLVLQMLGLGVVTAIVKRRFSWGAFAVGLGSMTIGIAVISAIVFVDSPGLYGWREMTLWGGSMGVMMVSGFLIGRVGRRVGFWECEAVTVILVTVVFIHLFKGWHIIFGVGPGDTESYLEFYASIQPGVRLLGSMWDRMLVLGAVTGFLLSVFGGSIAFLFYSEEGKLDVAFDFEWFISVRHLFGHRVSFTAVVAVLGVALGVASLVAVTAVMSGYQEDIQTKILSTNAHFVIQKYGIDFTQYDEVASAGLEHSQVEAATPFTFNEAMLATGDRGIGVLLKGVFPESAGTVTGIEDNLCRSIDVDGTCVHFDDDAVHLPELLAERNGVPSLIVGSELFKTIGLPVGSRVTLTTPVGIAGARGNAPRRLDFNLTGAFRSGMHDFDARLLYLDVRSSQRLMGLNGAVNGVEFRIKDPEAVDVVAREVLRTVGSYPYRTLVWRELNAGIFTALKLQKIVMFLVLTFIIVVAAFNIASTLFMAVVEKAREIAVLKSMGGRDASIMKIFVLEGWIVGGIGTGLGVFLGLLVCLLLGQLELEIAADVYMVESLQVRVNVLEVAVTAMAALIISHLATLYPALKAARERPVDAMRYQ